MPDYTITEVLKKGKILLSDGAMGTELHKRGLAPGESPEKWNLTNLSIVREISDSYVNAGSDIIMTNTLGANRIALGYSGLSDRVIEVNKAAVTAAKEAAGEDVFVMASVGPTGKMLFMEEITEAELYDVFKEQVIILEKSGADALCIETMSDIDEALTAIRAAKENTSLEVVCTFSYELTAQGEYRTIMGTKPGENAIRCLGAGADIVGTNCGNGIEQMAEITAEIKAAAPESLVLVQSNAGLPVNENGRTVFHSSPEQMAEFIPLLVKSGANIIGGCCGTTPDHIAKMREKIDNLKL